MSNNNTSLSTRFSGYKDDIRFLINKCLHNKLKILLALLACLFLAGFYLYRRQPAFVTEASITLYEDAAAPTSLVKQFSVGNLFGGSGSVYNEVQFLSSHTTMMRVVKRMGINKVYYVRKLPLKYEFSYPTPPISLVCDDAIADTLQRPIAFVIKGDFNDVLTVSAKTAGHKIGETKGKLPLSLETDYGVFRFEATAIPDDYDIKEKITLKSYSQAAEELVEKVDFNIPVKLADVVDITYKSVNKTFGIDLLNTIIDEYNSRGVEDSKLKGAQKLQFLDDRILSLADELGSSEGNIKEFKEENALTDLGSQARYYISKRGTLEKQILDSEAWNDVLRNTLAFIKNPANEYALLPQINIGDNDMSIINQYNGKVLERMRLIENVKPGNETLRRLDEQIAAIRSIVISTLESMVRNSDITLSELRRGLAEATNYLSKIPSQENVFRDILRDHSLKEQLYVFLLQQREETAMNIISTQGRGKMVNEPYVSVLKKQKSPIMIIAAAFLFGLFVMPAYWYVRYNIEKES